MLVVWRRDWWVTVSQTSLANSRERKGAFRIWASTFSTGEIAGLVYFTNKSLAFKFFKFLVLLLGLNIF